MLEADVRHYEELMTLPMLHGDPFDRLLIAQSKCEQMALVSRDRSLSAYGVPILW
jgi:PIN domain nuclease of toxin-antitoxin system